MNKGAQMTFDHATYGSISSDSRSVNTSVCVGGRFDDDAHWGMVRKSEVLAMQGRIGVSTPSRAQSDFAAALLVFTAFGLSQSQAGARARAGKYSVQWFDSASDVFKRGPDGAWEVPIALVVFARSW